MLKAVILAKKRRNKDTQCNAEGNQLISFCDTNNFEILNGKFWSDKRWEFTFINKLGSSALASEGKINNILGFKIRVGIISSYLSLLFETENTMEDTNNNTNITCETQLQKLIRYKWKDNYQYDSTDTMNGTA